MLAPAGCKNMNKQVSVFLVMLTLVYSFSVHASYIEMLLSACESWESIQIKSQVKTIAHLLKFHTRSANLRVPARVCDVEGGTVCYKNNTSGFFYVTSWTPLLRSPTPIMAPDTDAIHGIAPSYPCKLNNGKPKHSMHFCDKKRHRQCFKKKL